MGKHTDHMFPPGKWMVVDSKASLPGVTLPKPQAKGWDPLTYTRVLTQSLEG